MADTTVIFRPGTTIDLKELNAVAGRFGASGQLSAIQWIVDEELADEFRQTVYEKLGVSGLVMNRPQIG